MISRYLNEHESVDDRSLGHFMDWYINSEQQAVFGMKVPTGFQLIGQTRLKDYIAWVDYFAQQVKIQINKPVYQLYFLDSS